MRRRTSFLLVVFGFLGCVAPRGGWDLDTLEQKTPLRARYAGHRLADLVPFPELAGDRVRLVACRFAAGMPVRVQGVPGAPLGQKATSVALASRSLSRRVRGLELRWRESEGLGSEASVLTESALLDGPVIWVEWIAEEEAGGRRRGGLALGDTQSECALPKGTLISAGIRMRSRTTDSLGRSREVTEAEWLGAMMHELGHAVGFIGHVASGGSLMVREETMLRRWGQRVLDADSTETADSALELEPTLSALYALSPGEVLGERELTEDSLAAFARVRALEASRFSDGITLAQTVAKVGDRDARIEWRYSDGSRAGVWFRGWAEALRSGSPIEAELDLRTRRALIEAGL